VPGPSEKQLKLEARYEAQLKAENLRNWMRQFTSRPHNVGSPKAKENADFIAALFKKWGYETEIEVFHVLFPTPKTRELSLLRSYPFRASLKEQIIKTDSVADALEREALPPYNAYSGEGEVVDPLADGFARGAAYPAGAYKHGTAVQRGLVIDLPMRPGDPLTPDYGATKDAKRLKREDAETIMKIPVLPISSVDALPFFKALGGPVAPGDWRGALPVTYRLGDGKALVRLKAEFHWNLVPTYNVIARMKGSTFPDHNGSSAATTTTRGSSARATPSAASCPCLSRPASSVNWPRPAGARNARSSSTLGTARNPACSAPSNGSSTTPPF
jgi:N-acetylated-alpha-linked acidic dipeptidase